MRRGYGERAAKYVVDAPIRMGGFHTAVNRYWFLQSDDGGGWQAGFSSGLDEAIYGAFVAG